MKKFGLLSMVLVLIVGCGSSGDSTPARDGKGDIDIVEYLPSKNMIKFFSYHSYGGLLYGGSGFQNITVDENEINIEQHAQAGGRYYTGDVIQNNKITYNDVNISGFFEGYIEDLVDEKNYRYVDIGESLSSYEKSTISSLNDYTNDVLNIGTSTLDESYECFYKDITHNIKDTYNEVFKENGDFLVVECNKLRKVTYAIDKEYRDLSDKNGKSDYVTIKYLTYFEKGVGRIYDLSIENQTMETCKKNECQYGDNYGWSYRVNSIE